MKRVMKRETSVGGLARYTDRLVFLWSQKRKASLAAGLSLSLSFSQRAIFSKNVGDHRLPQLSVLCCSHDLHSCYLRFYCFINMFCHQFARAFKVGQSLSSSASLAICTSSQHQFFFKPSFLITVLRTHLSLPYGFHNLSLRSS